MNVLLALLVVLAIECRLLAVIKLNRVSSECAVYRSAWYVYRMHGVWCLVHVLRGLTPGKRGRRNGLLHPVACRVVRYALGNALTASINYIRTAIWRCGAGRLEVGLLGCGEGRGRYPIQAGIAPSTRPPTSRSPPYFCPFPTLLAPSPTSLAPSLALNYALRAVLSLLLRPSQPGLTSCGAIVQKTKTFSLDSGWSDSPTMNLVGQVSSAEALNDHLPSACVLGRNPHACSPHRQPVRHARSGTRCV